MPCVYSKGYKRYKDKRYIRLKVRYVSEGEVRMVRSDDGEEVNGI
jgi:hypothetical protein